MSDESEKKPSRAPESVKVLVTKCTNLRGTKSEALTSLVRVEYGQTLLGESSKIETTKDTKIADYNFTTSFECSFDEPYSFDGICQKPVVVIIAEVLPKDKKSKEEKTLTLGQCCIDLLPLLKGSKEFTVTQALTSPTVLSVSEPLTAEMDQPELEVTISVNQALLAPQELDGSNLFTVQMDSAYSVPESWQSGGQSFTYTVTLPVPITSQKENTVVIPNGLLRPPGEKEISQKRKWSIAPASSGLDLFIQESYVGESFTEEEHGDLHDINDLNFRRQAQVEKPRVTWNSERRCFLSSEAALSLQEKIAHNRVWPVEIMRLPMPSLAKGKGKQQSSDEDQNITFHGVAYVNMAPLLYPGIKKIQGAYLVKPYIDSEVFEKTKRRGNLMEEAAQISSGINRMVTPSAPAKLAASKTAAKDTKAKPSMSTLKAEATSEGEVTDAEGQQYIESRTFITMKIELDKPLVPKKPASSLARKVAEIIPPRPMFSKKTGGAKKAVDDYHAQIVNVANLLLDEFRYLNGAEIENGSLGQSHEDMESRRKAFLYELNTSGKYFAFKEQMKNAVIKIVREKYFHTSSFTDQEELQAFLSDLYVFLIDEMHKGLNKALSVDEEAQIPTSIVDNDMLKHFAEEAEVNQNYELAAKYYQERLAKNKNDPEYWFDYGTYCLLIGDISKADECFREVIAINQQHFKGLLLNGCVSLMQEKYEEVETFFEAATCVDEKSILAWTTLGLYYDSFQNDIGAERAFLEATRANAASIPKKLTPVAVLAEQNGAERKPSVNNDVSRRESAEIQETSVQKRRSSVIKTQKNTPRPQSSEHTAVDLNHNESTTEMDDKLLTEPTPPPAPPISIFLQTADFLLNVNALVLAEGALAHELVSNGLSALYHTLLARLHIQNENYDEAEENLNQALKLDHQSSNAWSLLGHVNYLTQRMDKARECYERTLAYVDEPTDIHSVLLRLANIYVTEGQFDKAKKQFLLACKRNPSPVSWLGVGISCYELGSLKEAEDALSEANILNNTDAEIWAYLSLVCLKTGRQLEAEQSYKYAIKLNLQNEDLLKQLHTMQERVGFGNPIAV
ncbi:cilia- and flagella-associated 70-like [Paramuricea clavata]|uniref:Cilia- and flagella-associated 70-like n=1 Tax=Paramuricea clavata TaxID=317549 RepID=A0A6S7FRF5_PARCT|nr:cilia- and flagella-associated 70-like [Paramuricea clavata]